MRKRQPKAGTLMGKNMTFRIPDDLKAWLKDEATRQRRSIGNLIWCIVEDYKNDPKRHDTTTFK